MLKDGEPFMAIGTPGRRQPGADDPAGVPQRRRVLGEWYPNLHAAFRWPRVQTLHFYGSFWPHPAGFNKLNVEADVPDAVYEELQAAGTT